MRRAHDRIWRWLAGADSARRPGMPFDEALAPVPLLCLVLLVVNDRYLKSAAPGALTGKLSDVAGLAVAPLVLTAAIDCLLNLAARFGAPVDWTLRRWKLIAAIAATGVVFAAVKIFPWASSALADLLAGIFGQSRIVTDRTDLFTLPALAIAWWQGRRTLAHVPYGRVAWALHNHVPGARALSDVPGDTSALAAAIDSASPSAADAALSQLR